MWLIPLPYAVVMLFPFAYQQFDIDSFSADFQNESVSEAVCNIGCYISFIQVGNVYWMVDIIAEVGVLLPFFIVSYTYMMIVVSLD
jgi:hypothetical protein